MSELLLGCGKDLRKRVWMPDQGIPQDWSADLTTLDFNEDHKPDVVWDLEQYPWPFDNDRFDEIHAYEVMEHLGRQGDYVSFFAHFHEIWRMLKDGGYFVMTSPRWDGQWAWGDPGHRRIISGQALSFLDRDNYNEETTRTDYRRWWRGDLVPVTYQQDDDTLLAVLRARKHD